MDFSIDSLLPYEDIQSDSDRVFSVVEKSGKVVLFKDNMPLYIIIKYDAANGSYPNSFSVQVDNHTLQEAMRIVLLGAENKTMHAAKLADEIFERKLYLQKNGEKARYTQVRSRCDHYPKMFEALPKNYISLRESGK